MGLNWPLEAVLEQKQISGWHQSGSNIVLDFHGDPIRSQLTVFSDGNHHMALLDALKSFRQQHPEVGDIFYATTPPHPIVQMLRTGMIRLGNLCLSVRPDVFISPPAVMQRLEADGLVGAHRLLARNQGSVLLIRRGNPRNILSVADLQRSDVRCFFSNPKTETVSFEGYRRTLEGVAARLGLDPDRFHQTVFEQNGVFGAAIHHREAPEAVAADRADAAIVYYHLALRYIRIFPETFDFVPLGGTRSAPAPYPENLIARFHIGVVGDGGSWGSLFAKFMLGPEVARIYTDHGLHHAADS